MVDSMMAMMLNQADSRTEERKDALMQALENQEKVFSGLKGGNVGNHRNRDMDKKLNRMAIFLSKEKKMRERQRRIELKNTQQMMDSILQFSIMMNSGQNDLMKSMLPYTNVPNFGQMGANIMGDIGLNGPQLGNMALDPSMQQNLAGGNMYGPGGAQQQAQQQVDPLEKKKKEEAKKRLKKLKKKAREKKKIKKELERKKKEVRDREQENLDEAIKYNKQLANKNEQEAIEELDRERRDKNNQEAERIRKEKEAQAERDRKAVEFENRREQLWLHYMGIVYLYMSPLIFFEVTKEKVMRTYIPSTQNQVNSYRFLEAFLTDMMRPKMIKFMQNFVKNSSKFVTTDDQALIKEYKESVPRPDQIKTRVEYVISTFEDLIGIIKDVLKPDVFPKEKCAILGQAIENRQFPIKNHFLTMEVIRMKFDSFGRIK